MKSKLIFSTFILSVFLLGLAGGFYAGVVGATGSNSSQLYAGAQEMRAALISLEKMILKMPKQLFVVQLRLDYKSLT